MKSLFLILTTVLIFSFNVSSQSTISVTYNLADIETNFTDPPLNDPACHIHSLDVVIPEDPELVAVVTNVNVSYNMEANESNNGKVKDQRSKIFFTNASIEESVWAEGQGNTGGNQNYDRDITIANGPYAGGTNLNFEMWAARIKQGNAAGCNTQVNKVTNNTWTIEVEYFTVKLDTGGVGIGTDTPDPSAILELQSQQRGFLPPRMIEGQLNFIQNPAEGLMVYCIDCSPAGLYTMKNGNWETLGNSTGGFIKEGSLVRQNSTSFDENFIFGRSTLPDNSMISDTFMFFDQTKGAFRGGLLTNDSRPWQPDSLGVGSFAYGENLYAPSFGEIAIGINNESYVPQSVDSFNLSDRIFSIGNGNGILSNIFGAKKYSNAFTVMKNGRVGIGVSTPTANLHVDGQIRATGTSVFSMSTITGIQTFKIESSGSNFLGTKDGSSKLTMSNSGGNGTIELDAREGTDGAHIELKNNSGNTLIKLQAGYGATAKGTITTDIIEIHGGSDFAEYFDVNEKTARARPGMVVCIDENNSGNLVPCQSRYDNKVIGIISGANGVDAGMIMGQEGTLAFGNTPVSLIGRVYVKCNSENGDIKPGDFLTTSSKLGEAMKVKKYKKASGAILGKALSTIDPKTGFVLVLVNLQ